MSRARTAVGLVFGLAAACVDGSAVAAAPADSAGAVKQAWSMLSDGQFFEVEKLLADFNAAHPGEADTVFLQGVVSRAHFDITGGDALLAAAARLRPDTAQGKAAAAVVAVDTGDNGKAAFDQLRTLIHDNPTDPSLLWLGAIVGRTVNSNDEAVNYFEALGKFFQTGPPLFHQTFANVLDQLHRYDEALPHRELAVKLYPSGWAFDGLGNTLSGLKRFREADAAGAKAVEADPLAWRYWENYGNTAWKMKRYDDAEARYQKAIGLNATASLSRFWLADSLERQGKLAAALDQYTILQRQQPNDEKVRLRIVALNTKIKAQPPAATQP